jgi:hypothetical protein
MLIGSRFTSVGLAVDAVTAYIKCNNIKDAIDAAVLVHAWDAAVELAERYVYYYLLLLDVVFIIHLLL